MPFDTILERPLSLEPLDDLTLLQLCRHAISTEEGWCREHYEDGGAHCAVGWMMHFRGTPRTSRLVPAPGATYRTSDAYEGADVRAADAQAVVRLLYPVLPPSWKQVHRPSLHAVTVYNDKRSKRSVLKLFDRAIARLGGTPWTRQKA